MISTNTHRDDECHENLASSLLSPEDSRRILYKLRDLNLLAERLRLEDGRRIDMRGCLHPDAPVHGKVHYRLGLGDNREVLLGIDIKDSRLHLTLSATETGTPSRSRYLPMAIGEGGRATCAQIGTTLDPSHINRPELQCFLQELVLACLPASN
jgi:hypothetical protein